MMNTDKLLAIVSYNGKIKIENCEDFPRFEIVPYLQN